MLTVLAGATGAQVLPLLVAPLLTRACTPVQIGSFSLWLGVIAVTSIIATLRFEAAMVLDHDSQQQSICFGVVNYSATALALALTALAICARYLGFPAVWRLTWFELLTIGAGTWLTANMQTTLSYAAAHNLFAKAAKARMLQAGTIAVSQLALVHAGLDTVGLLAGQLIGLTVELAAAWRLLSPPARRIGLILSAEQRRYLIKHQAFWRYALPSSLLNTLVGQLPLLIIGIKFSPAAAGCSRSPSGSSARRLP